MKKVDQKLSNKGISKQKTPEAGKANKSVSSNSEKGSMVVVSKAVLNKTKTSRRKKVTTERKVSKKQFIKDIFSNHDSDIADLNTSTNYPVHPNRIWPD